MGAVTGMRPGIGKMNMKNPGAKMEENRKGIATGPENATTMAIGIMTIDNPSIIPMGITPNPMVGNTGIPI